MVDATGRARQPPGGQVRGLGTPASSWRPAESVAGWRGQAWRCQIQAQLPAGPRRGARCPMLCGQAGLQSCRWAANAGGPAMGRHALAAGCCGGTQGCLQAQHLRCTWRHGGTRRSIAAAAPCSACNCDKERSVQTCEGLAQQCHAAVPPAAASRATGACRAVSVCCVSDARLGSPGAFCCSCAADAHCASPVRVCQQWLRVGWLVERHLLLPDLCRSFQTFAQCHECGFKQQIVCRWRGGLFCRTLGHLGRPVALPARQLTLVSW
jgi:hypothetical protein